jgi:anti-sigma B factor antagonist
MSPFTIDLGGEGDQRRLVLSGELDLSAREEILTAGTAGLAGDLPTLVIDLSLVTFLDSSALGAFVGLLNIAAESGKSLTLTNPTAPVQRVFDLTGLAAVFGLVPPSAETGAG